MENKQGGTAGTFPSLQTVFPCGHRFRIQEASRRGCLFCIGDERAKVRACLRPWRTPEKFGQKRREKNEDYIERRIQQRVRSADERL